MKKPELFSLSEIKRVFFFGQNRAKITHQRSVYMLVKKTLCSFIVLKALCMLSRAVSTDFVVCFFELRVISRCVEGARRLPAWRWHCRAVDASLGMEGAGNCWWLWSRPALPWGLLSRHQNCPEIDDVENFLLSISNMLLFVWLVYDTQG